MFSPRRAAQVLALGVSLVMSACAEPPNKEMHQAQGAIDAARAAGAERYAADALAAAVKALEQANAAAAQRDYRLALNHALDSREQAQNAAREAAAGRASARSRAERLLADVTTALATATARLEAAEGAKLPKSALADPGTQIATVQKAVQEAGAALGREDYIRAAQVLEGRVDAVHAATTQIDQALAAPPPRPARRRR
jgi:flagellar hook-basal body complex protein FliE